MLKKNLEAQNYLVNEIGKYKVDALNDRYGEKFQIMPHTKFIANYKELNSLVDGLTDTDILINASDDHELMLRAPLKTYEKRYNRLKIS